MKFLKIRFKSSNFRHYLIRLFTNIKYLRVDYIDYLFDFCKNLFIVFNIGELFYLLCL